MLCDFLSNAIMLLILFIKYNHVMFNFTLLCVHTTVGINSEVHFEMFGELLGQPAF